MKKVSPLRTFRSRCGLPLLVVAFGVICGWRLAHVIRTGSEPYRQYSLRVTRRLVATVMEAKRLLATQGDRAFPILDDMRSRHPGLYLYVYRREDGLCVYHGNNPDWVGRRLDTFTDELGKNVHELINAQLENPRNPHGWVHYHWHRPHGLFLEWKSSCNRPVTLPDGTACYVGCGLHGLGTELEFARIAVTEAEYLLTTRGEQALAELLSPASVFFFYGTAVFVLRSDGTSIIDPVLKTRQERDLGSYQDAVGRYPFRFLLRRLAESSEAQVILYQHSPTSMNVQKKMLYARTCRMGDERVIVGTVIDAPRSVWQR